MGEDWTFEGAAGRHFSTGAPEATAVIKLLQPFYEGDIWDFNNRWILNELARLDRHRFPHFGAVRNENIELDRTRSQNIKIESMEVLRGPIQPELEDCADLAKFVAYPANPNEKMRVHFTRGLSITMATGDTLPTIDGDQVDWVMSRAVRGAEEAIRKLRPFLDEAD